MGGTCSTHGGEEKCLKGFDGKNWEGDNLEDLDVARRII
jgi:hypothetical protein